MLRYIDRKRQIIKSIYTGIGKTVVIYPISFLVATAQGMITLGIIFYLKEFYKATPSQIGYITALWSLSYIVGCLFFRPLSDRILPRYILIASSFIKFFLIAIGTLIFVIGLCLALNYSNSVFHGISGSTNRAKRMSIHESLISFGLILGSSIGGVIYHKFSMKTLFVLCAAFVLFGALIQWLLYLILVSKKQHFK